MVHPINATALAAASETNLPDLRIASPSPIGYMRKVPGGPRDAYSTLGHGRQKVAIRLRATQIAEVESAMVIRWHSHEPRYALVSLCRGKVSREAPTMQMSTYLSFNGHCEAAFKCYEHCFGAKPATIFRYAGSPMVDQVPADWQDKVMHGTLMIGDQVLMGGDVAPDRYEEPRGFSLSLQITSVMEAERLYHELRAGGRVVMPLEKTFWAERFGMVVDRFGIPWLINCEGTDSSSGG
jgi:PhnB protein